MSFNFVYVLICTSHGSSKVTDAYFDKQSADDICEIRNSYAQMDGGTRVYTVQEVFITDAPV